MIQNIKIPVASMKNIAMAIKLTHFKGGVTSVCNKMPNFVIN